MWFAVICVFFAIVMPAAAQQGLDTRRSASEYPVHGAAGDIAVAAEFHYRALDRGRDAIFLREGLVVEVALFASGKQRVPVSASKFWLRVNGKKLLLAIHSGLVLSQDRYGSQPALNVQVMDGNVQIGGPAERQLPEESGRQAPVPRVEDPNLPQREAPSMAELLDQMALPEGKRSLPIAGLVYFHYKKKMKSIKKLELIYESPTGEAVALKFR
jgi:hypothetical protein